MEHEQWTGKTGGTPWMHKLLMASLRVLPLWFVYTGMALFVIPFYMLFAHRGYISQYHFFRQRLGYNSFKAFIGVYCNHVRFGQVIIDRFYFYAGGKFHFEMENYDLYLKLSHEPSGFVVLSSHVGNYELAGYELKAQEKQLYALVFAGEAAAVMSNRNRLLAANNIHMTPVTDDMSHLFILSNALADGNIVSIPADRIFGSPRTITCNFMGAEAAFPLGPFVLATQRDDVPVLSVQVMKEGIKRYRIIIRQLPVNRQAGRTAQRAKDLAQTFATHLEGIVKQYPTQWFNYYEFWQQNSNGTDASAV